MFYFFTDNYMWSQATSRALGTGAFAPELSEVLEALKSHSAEGSVDQWFDAWSRLAEKVYDYGEREAADDHLKSAGQTFLRACSYFQWATNFMDHTDPRRLAAHRKSLDAFGRFAASRSPVIERVEVPFENGAHIPGWFVPGEGDEIRKPSVLFLSGVDAAKEQGYPFARELQERGFNVFMVDGPGVVEALLFQNLVNRHDEEVPGGACIDYMLSREDVDPERLAVVGVSLGAYRASRLSAFDDRVRAMVAWGGNWDRYETMKTRIETRWKDLSAPPRHYLHSMGVETVDELLEQSKLWNLSTIVHQITCPVLITHGVHDKQTPVDYAYKLYDGVSSDVKELKIFTEETGGVMHCQNDNRILAYTYIGDWLEDTLVRKRLRSGIIDGWARKA